MQHRNSPRRKQIQLMLLVTPLDWCKYAHKAPKIIVSTLIYVWRGFNSQNYLFVDVSELTSKRRFAKWAVMPMNIRIWYMEVGAPNAKYNTRCDINAGL